MKRKSNGGKAGIALIMYKKIGMRVSYYEQHSERIIVAKIDTQSLPTTVVQVYMAISSADYERNEEMYDEIKDRIQFVKGDENLIVVGDWNSVVGKGRAGKIVKELGLGEINVREIWLVEICTEHNLIIANTSFKKLERSLCTWKRPGNTGTFQIDYIVVRQRFRNQILNC